MKTILLLLGFILPFTGGAQQYKLAWSNTKGGGSTHSNGRYTLSSTIGQPQTGTITNGHYALNLGFQRIIAALQTTGAPLLTIKRSGVNVIVSWPSPSIDFVLQQMRDLNTTNWFNYSGTVNNDGTTKSVTISPPFGNLFFRLKK